jgi:hypothetical protein
MCRASLALIFTAASAALPLVGRGQTWSFNPGGEWTASWQNAGNWTPNSSFPNSATGVATLAASSIGSGSGTILVSGSGITVNRINFAATGTNSNGYTIAGAGTLMIPSGGTIDVETGGIGTLGGVVATPPASIFYKTGGGLLVLDGVGRFGYVTGLSIEGGTVRVTRTGAMPSAGFIATHGDGQLELQNANTTGALIFNASATSANPKGTIYSSAGNNNWEGNWFVSGSNSVGVVAGTTFTLSGNIMSGTSYGPYGFAKTGAGTFAATSLDLNGVIRIDQGTLVLREGPRAISIVSGVDIAGGATPTARLDLTSARLVVRNGTEATIKQYLQAGRNGGAWNGNGMTSSIAEADASAHGGTTSFAIGYARGDQLTSFNGATATFGGIEISASDIAITLTRAGDTDLDADVDLDDFSRFITGYVPQSFLPKSWFNGDFDHDGVIGLESDFALFARGYADLGGSLTSLSNAVTTSALPPADQLTMQSIISNTPEPGVLLAGVIPGALAILGRRRRN